MIISYTDEKARYFRKRLATWSKKNIRQFPWRETLNPFHILLAEMMLRRTNAPQVVPVYLNAIQRYPDPQSLTMASQDEVLNVFRSLGLMWRTQNIRKMAEALVERFNGQVPNSYEKLKQLPGVGDYVASVVCCFAFGKSIAIVDTNTVRVVGRYFGFKTNAESRRRLYVRESVKVVTRNQNTRTYNMAFLDFSALVCKAINPECPTCPLLQLCSFGRELK